MKDLLESLNTAQRECAQHIDGSLLILAGAGSGKTKTLTTRLAYLLSEIGIPAQNTLTLTFTNKAASEMRERALQLIAKTNLSIATTPLLCTFHKFGLLFLQRYIHLLERKQSFIVIDEDDRKKILRDIKKQNKQYDIPNLSSLSSFISDSKNANIMPDDITSQDISLDFQAKIKTRIYKQYQDSLREYNLVDFDDLLLLPYRILCNNKELAIGLSKKYQYIMVDEYQDVNNLQADFLKLLCVSHENLCVVGDDDQSIYGWRGANISNILDFDKQFKNTKIITLEQNYRSTQQILDIANKLISYNPQRYNKTLKGQKQGDKARILSSIDDKEEMRKVILSIKELVQNGCKYSDIAILFRLNPLSLNVEKSLSQAKIPYQMIGGIKFYERQEIKDALAYLRLGLDSHDDFALQRIINKPRRGIGEKSLIDIMDLSSIHGSVYEAFKNNAYKDSKYQKKLQDIFEIIDLIKECIRDNLHFLSQIFSTRIKLYHEDDKPDFTGISNADRRKNIDELFRQFWEYCDEINPLSFSNQEDILREFLNNIALASPIDKVNEQGVVCMSIHNSKGLEFEHVFLIGMERGLFPLYDRYDDELDVDSGQIRRADIFEERRLAYVAFTRAKTNLILSYVNKRSYRGQTREREISQFFIESSAASFIDFENTITKSSWDNMIASLGFDNKAIKNKEDLVHLGKDSLKEESFSAGDCVQHKVLGFGRIESIKGVGAQSRAVVNFGGLRREILLSFLIKL
ncbi:ATP-dependent helicase [Helicobacter muridarum]|uniref:DNA 3'-5' helicase n=1 Tax=Helicobacter muridarum TaxID=216 RepID=A0A099TXP2_9HELI|nr:ATP-dependent helicase [Helicobacter muridarum]TLE01353.1 ATP-dependent helicase [Helicobacter muridarum]STQ85278.1 ATP-dependent DNA helicase [Helicobacter muridarum]